jgi:hypothetical protein
MGLGIPGAYVGITLRATLGGGGDADAVARWVTEHGGTSETAPAIQSHGLRPGRVIAREKPPTPYFLIPAAELEGSE